MAAAGRFKRAEPFKRPVENEFRGVTLGELRKKCEEAKLPTDGKREDLISRLQQQQTATKMAKTPGRRARSDGDKAEEDLKRAKQPNGRVARTGQVLKELNER